MPPSSTTLSAPIRPILQTFDRTPGGYRFRFTYREKILILDTDHDGREFAVHLEWPPEDGWPSAFVREAALEQVRRILLTRRVPR